MKSKFPYIADEVNKRLQEDKPSEPVAPAEKLKYLLVGGFNSGNMARAEALKAFLDAEKIYCEWR